MYAFNFTSYIDQACQRVCELKPTRVSKKSRTSPLWYDAECRTLRSLAVQAGERVISEEDKKELNKKTRAYRSCKQRKQRSYKQLRLAKIEKVFKENRTDAWSEINKICRSQPLTINAPSGEEFFKYFKKLSQPIEIEYFNDGFFKKG